VGTRVSVMLLVCRRRTESVAGVITAVRGITLVDCQLKLVTSNSPMERSKGIHTTKQSP
jgi:hypothetical protein